MLRADRFKHRLLDENFLQHQGPQAFQCLKPFLQMWDHRVISDAEIAAIYITIFSFLRRPRDFFGGKHSHAMTETSLKESLSCRDFLQTLLPTLPTDLSSAKSLRRFEINSSFLNFACAHTWRSIPLSVNRSLAAWAAGNYPLKILTFIPSPEEVLEMQSQGKRCVSMLIQLKEIQSFVDEGRDVLGFIAHDLIHADHFFADLEKAKAQILFSQKLQSVFLLEQIKKMMAEDSIFKGEFEYLMSDMNSVPLHLLKTLKAVLLGYFKRNANLKMTESLPEALEYEFYHLFRVCLEPWGFCEEALLAAKRLNTARFESPADGVLLHNALSTNFHDGSPEVC